MNLEGPLPATPSAAKPGPARARRLSSRSWPHQDLRHGSTLRRPTRQRIAVVCAQTASTTPVEARPEEGGRNSQVRAIAFWARRIVAHEYPAPSASDRTCLDDIGPSAKSAPRSRLLVPVPPPSWSPARRPTPRMRSRSRWSGPAWNASPPVSSGRFLPAAPVCPVPLHPLAGGLRRSPPAFFGLGCGRKPAVELAAPVRGFVALSIPYCGRLARRTLPGLGLRIAGGGPWHSEGENRQAIKSMTRANTCKMNG
jgi:hypothetical protein